MVNGSLVFIFTLHAIFLNGIDLSLARDECNSNSDCHSSISVCCAGPVRDSDRSCWFGSCTNHYCSTDGDCGGVGECCMSNQCGTFGCRECYSNSDCAFSEYCCKHRYINDHNVCRRSCIGETCHSDSDCGGPGEYCDGNNKCSESNIIVRVWVAPVLVVGLLLFVFVGGGVFGRRYFLKRPQRVARRVLPAAERATAIIALQETHMSSNPPAPVCYPPPYFNKDPALPTISTLT